jgi:DNA-binding response OmpR family regulator
MMKPKDILIVGGETPRRQALAKALKASGAFRISDVASAEEALARTEIRTQRFDAIIIDTALPDLDGPEFCGRIRGCGMRMPIIMLSELSTENEVVRALDAGANDYVKKPFRIAELAARLRAQIREHDMSDDAILLIGPYDFRPGARTLHEPVGNVRIQLTHKEAAILKCLYRASGRPVSRQMMLEEVWGWESAAHSHTLDQHIYRCGPAGGRGAMRCQASWRLRHDHPRGTPAAANRPAAGTGPIERAGMGRG